MEEEFLFMDLCDADLPAASKEAGSRLSISTIVDAMCCLETEETLRIIGTSKGNDALAKPDVFTRRKSVGHILGEIGRVPKTHSVKTPAGPPTPPSTLKGTESEPALAVFMASEDNKGQEVDGEKRSKTSSGPSIPDLYKLLEISWPWNSAQQSSAARACNSNKNSEEAESSISLSDISEGDLSCLEDTTYDLNSAPQGDCVAAEPEETDSAIRVTYTSLNALWLLEDTNGKQIPGPQDDVEVTKSVSPSSDINKTDLALIKRTHATLCSGDSVQNRNTEHGGRKGITHEESPIVSIEDQPQEVTVASKKQQRRGWKGVRRPISHLFYGLFCCLPTPKKGDTSSSLLPPGCCSPPRCQESRNWCNIPCFNSYIMTYDSFIMTYDSYIMTYDSFIMTYDSYIMTYDSYIMTYDSYIMTYDSYIMTYDSFIMTYDSYIMTYDSYIMTYDSYIMTYDSYIMTYDSFIMTYDSYIMTYDSFIMSYDSYIMTNDFLSW